MAPTLTWTCQTWTASSCSIDSQQVCSSADPSSANACTSGTLPESPTQNTSYTLFCTPNNYISPPSPPMSSTVTVTVQNPGIHEVNP